MSTQQPQHVNHPLTQLIIDGIHTATSITRKTLKGFRVMKECLSEVEASVDSKYQKLMFKLGRKTKEESFKPKKASQKKEQSLTKLNEVQRSLVKPGKERMIGVWMMTIAVLVYGMICLGAYTRLLKMGHSITGMHPLGIKGHVDAFRNYVEHTLWKKDVNFEFLFLHEYLSTLFERAIGLAFIIPFGYFLMRGYIKQKLRNRLFGLIGMQVLQSFMGAWIHNLEVRHKLGLGGKILVSPYRMFIHWNTTMVMFGVLLWNALTLLRNPKEKSLYGGFKDTNSMRKKMMINLGINIGNFMTGVIVAAIDGSREFNTFPDMDGNLIPEGYLHEKSFFRNFFESVATTQFHHRLFAYGTYTAAVCLFILSRKYNLSRAAKNAMLVLFIFANLQLIDGYLVLKTRGYWLVGLFHQSNAIWILGASLFALHALSIPFRSNLSKDRQEEGELEESTSQKNIEGKSSNESSSMKTKENPGTFESSSQSQEEKKGASTEPIGETSKEETNMAEHMKPESSVHSSKEQDSLNKEELGSEPVFETSK